MTFIITTCIVEIMAERDLNGNASPSGDEEALIFTGSRGLRSLALKALHYTFHHLLGVTEEHHGVVLEK